MNGMDQNLLKCMRKLWGSPHEQYWKHHDRGKGVPSFDEMMDIALVEVDFDDPTTNVHDVAP